MEAAGATAAVAVGSAAEACAPCLSGLGSSFPSRHASFEEADVQEYVKPHGHKPLPCGFKYFCYNTKEQKTQR